ncbi:unnamed protein product, partial [Medioppia subpectinata]
MSGKNGSKMSAQQKSQLISELAASGEDRKLIKLFAEHIATTTSLNSMTSMTLQEALQMGSDNENDSSDEYDDDDEEEEVDGVSDADDEDNDDDDYDEEEDEESDDEEVTDGQHMCADCKCAAKKQTVPNGVASTAAAAATAAQHSAKKSKSGAKKSKNKGSVDANDENTKRFVERLGREDSQSCGCDDCVKYASDRQTADDMAVKLVADEEKKKKKSEKKKLQKKKKRDKKK